MGVAKANAPCRWQSTPGFASSALVQPRDMSRRLRGRTAFASPVPGAGQGSPFAVPEPLFSHHISTSRLPPGGCL